MFTFIKEAAKFWIAIGGFAVTSATAEFGSLPALVTYAAGLLTAIAVYIVPNAAPNQPDVPRSINDRTP